MSIYVSPEECPRLITMPDAMSSNYTVFVYTENWRALGDWLEGQPLMSLFEGIEVPKMDDSVMRYRVLQTPWILSHWSCWHTAMVWSWFHKKNFEVFRDTQKPMSRDYKVVQKCFKDLFLHHFSDKPSVTDTKAVQAWMLVNNRQLMPYVIQNLFFVAEDIETLLGQYEFRKDLSGKDYNKLKFRFDKLLEREAEIKAIPEFGQYLES